MPSPITIGRPSDWRVRPQAASSAQRLRCRRATNETKTCEVPGCDHNRSGLSRYCSNHHGLASRRGDPKARVPARNELAIFRYAISVYLTAHPKLAERIARDLTALERPKSLPSSYCLSPASIHPKLPQIAKAKGLLANWYHREGRTYTDAVVNATTLVGWMAVYYDTGLAGGLWRNRKAFLHTRAGALLGHFSKTVAGQTLTKRASGATHRRLGADFVADAKAIYGDLWSSPVATGDGKDMTLLNYTKLALQAASLL